MKDKKLPPLKKLTPEQLMARRIAAREAIMGQGLLNEIKKQKKKD